MKFRLMILPLIIATYATTGFAGGTINDAPLVNVPGSSPDSPACYDGLNHGAPKTCNGQDCSVPNCGGSEGYLPCSYDGENSMSINDQVQLQGLPKIGKWMLHGPDAKHPTAYIANWLGDKDAQGKSYQEPINVIIRIPVAKGSKQVQQKAAEKSLLLDLQCAGFNNEIGHSDGYKAVIDGLRENQFNPQQGQGLPVLGNYAFSDGNEGNVSAYLPGFQNDHMRIFGPVISNGQAVFTAALSREKVVGCLRGIICHPIASFNEARNNLVLKIKQKGCGKLAESVPLQNAIPASSHNNLTTGDYDGQGAVLDLPALPPRSNGLDSWNKDPNNSDAYGAMGGVP